MRSKSYFWKSNPSWFKVNCIRKEQEGDHSVLCLANSILLITYSSKSLLRNLTYRSSQAVLISNKGKKLSITMVLWVNGIRKMEIKIKPIISIKRFYLFKILRQMTKHCLKKEWSDTFSCTDTLQFLYLYKLYFIRNMVCSCKYILLWRGKQVSCADACGWDKQNQLVLGTESLLTYLNNKYTTHHYFTDSTMYIEIIIIPISLLPRCVVLHILNIKPSCSLHSPSSKTIKSEDTWFMRFSVFHKWPIKHIHVSRMLGENRE